MAVREAVNAEQLVKIIRAALAAALGPGSGFGGIYKHVPDAAGCNWSVWTTSAQLLDETAGMRALITQLQASYNIGDPMLHTVPMPSLEIKLAQRMV